MAGTKDIKDFTKYPSLSDNDYLLGTKTDLGGTDAGMLVSTLKKQIATDAAPIIRNGYWWVNGLNTGLAAAGKTPVFRTTERGIEMKYEGEDDAAYTLLLPMSSLVLKYENLTKEQVSDLRLTWDKLTPEQKEELKGKKGDKGDSFIYENFTSEQLLSLRGSKGDKGDSYTYNLLGSYISLNELNSVYPSGTEENGFFMAGDKMYIWNPIDMAFKEIKLEIDKVFTSEFFTEVPIKGNKITIDYLKTPHAKVVLSGNPVIYNLEIQNTKNGAAGKIMVYQTGFKQIVSSLEIRGSIDLPLSSDTIAILFYNRVDDYIYIHTATVIGDTSYPVPQKVKDFQLIYSDNTTCIAQWTAPYANNIYDKATEYDVRYANDIADASDLKTWNGLRKVDNIVLPEKPGVIQKLSISGLVPNREYYVYIKSIRINSGVEYISEASDFLYFRTTGNTDTNKSYRIPLSLRNLKPQHSAPNTDSDGTLCSIDRTVDEIDKNKYLEDGYPDMTNKDYTTYWSESKYKRSNSPYDLFIDLFSIYVLDKIFIYSRGKPKISVWCMKDFGYTWEKAGALDVYYNEWVSVDFNDYQCRFIKLSFDLMDFGSVAGMPEGSEGFPSDEWNGTIDRIDNLIIYGRPLSTTPDGIMSPVRRSTIRKTVDQFFCVNGHLYQQGRIHSLCSGKQVRLYISPGWFASWDENGLRPCGRVADMLYQVEDIGWVKNNNGTGELLKDHLTNTYKRFGLLPYITFTGVFDYCQYDKSTGDNHLNRAMDCYWIPEAWKAVPSRGVGGTDKYFKITYDANQYKTMGKLAYALTAKYGTKKISSENLFWPLNSDKSTGYELISGIEIENEPDQDWNNWRGYTRPEEYAAIVSAAADGNGGELVDEDGNKTFGVKRADTNMLAIGSGTAGVHPGYYESAILHWKSRRKKADIPVDAFSIHRYFSISGNQHSGSTAATQYAVNAEYAVEQMVTYIKEFIELRDRFAPDKEIWLTEFGYGESGGRESNSGLQCFTMPGRAIGDWIIPDCHRSDVKGAWTVRATVYFMSLGIDQINYYSTECEGNYFDSGQWGSGPGFEMWHWNDCTDLTPGAKDEAIKKYEHGYNRGGFASMGLFGNILSNGAYPITRAYWWIATMRNRLKGYVYTGRKYIDFDDRIMVFCFKKQDEDKGAYVVYLNNSKNTGIPNVEIPVPNMVNSVKHVVTYVPETPNPQTVPNSLGLDKNRTGLTTSRHEIYENGAWVVKSKGDYTSTEAIYPSNPVEGQEIVVLPSKLENPYFPIVGPVQAISGVNGNTLSAQQYETLSLLPGKYDVNYDIALAWRQVEAVCDYIDYAEEGIHGSNGDEAIEQVLRGMIQTNVSEFPEYFFFDAVPNPDYRSEITDLSSKTTSSSSIELWWNNTSIEDTGYEIFSSDLPETGYSLLKTIPQGIDNKAVILGLPSDTTGYYKVRPIRGNSAGTLSDYTSAKTYAEIKPPTHLSLESRTATSVKIKWTYNNGQIADFVRYAIYRSSETGAYAEVGTVDDISVLSYNDMELQVGKIYKYKVRAIGLNGQSVFSNELETRTLLAEECSPTLKNIITDKLGSKIILIFDLSINTIENIALSEFTLTEDNNIRLISSVYRDEANNNRVILKITEGALNDYEKKSDIRLSYSGENSISSIYGVYVEPFENKKVTNVIGNFSNLEAIYQINLCSLNTEQAEGWNNLPGNANSQVSISNIVDTYERISSVSVSTVHNGKDFKWGGDKTGGYAEIEGVSLSVYSSIWNTAFGNNSSESVKSRILISGLDNEKRYTIKAYGGCKYGTQRYIKFKIGDMYSNTISNIGNTKDLMILDDISSVQGEIKVDFIQVVDGNTTDYALVSFIIIEEYRSNNDPMNTEVWLREISVLEDEGDRVVKSPSIGIHLNCIGATAEYRISEVQDFTGASWISIVNNDLDVPYILSEGFGEKDIYVQVRNLYVDSNIRSIRIEYKDPFVPLVLKNIYVNNDDSITYTRKVKVLTEKEGIPTHFRVAETSDLSQIPWAIWQDSKISEVPYELSVETGQKTVYLQMKDETTETAVKVDMIEYLTADKLPTED